MMFLFVFSSVYLTSLLAIIDYYNNNKSIKIQSCSQIMYKYLQSYLITILVAMLIELTTFILSCREGAISNLKSRTCLKYIIYFRLSIYR